MSTAGLVVRLYPPAVRERWGVDLEQQVIESGPRSWPNAALGAAGLWLRPTLWPAATTGQRRHTTALLVFVIAAMTALLLRATPPSAFNTGLPGWWDAVWLTPVLLGILAAVPTPRFERWMISAMIVVCARTLAPAALAVLGMLVLAHTGVVNHQAAWAHLLLVGCYWATLAFAGARSCALVARTGHLTTPPSLSRLRVALALIGLGLTLAVVGVFVTLTRGAFDIGTVGTAATLIVLVGVVTASAHDLHGSTNP